MRVNHITHSVLHLYWSTVAALGANWVVLVYKYRVNVNNEAWSVADRAVPDSCPAMMIMLEARSATSHDDFWGQYDGQNVPVNYIITQRSVGILACNITAEHF